MLNKKIVVLLFIGILFILQNCGLFAQSDSSLYQLRQIKGSENKLKDFFNKSKLDFSQDTLYAIIIKPMSCPRCEGLVNPSFTLIRQADSSAETALLIRYSKKNVIRQYLSQKQFTASHALADLEAQLNQIFLSSSRDFRVPYLCKIHLPSGTLIHAMPLLGIQLNEAHIKQFMARSNPAPKVSLQQTSTILSQTSAALDQPLKPKLIRLQETEAYPISRPISLSLSPDGSKCVMIDDISMHAQVYDTKTGEQLAVFESLEAEYRAFIGGEVQEEVYQFLRSSGIISVLYLNAHFTDNHRLQIAASLPYVYYENLAAEELVYYNEACFVYKSLLRPEHIEVMAFDSLPESGWAYSHTDAYQGPSGWIYMPLQKGWPAVGTTQLDQVALDLNPLTDSFYHYAPQLARFDEQGKADQYMGRLDPMYKRLRLGYYANNVLIREAGQKLWVATAPTGNFVSYTLDTHQLLDSICIFPPLAPPLPSPSPDLDYITNTFTLFFPQRVEDFLPMDSLLYVLTASKSAPPCVLKIEAQSGRVIDSTSLPLLLGEARYLRARLHREERGICLYSLYSSDEAVFVNRLDLE